MNKKDLKFDCTCFACPEQYDVLYGDDIVAYVRLRGGYLYCRCGDTERIYEAWPRGDGCFWDEEEREHYLNIIKDKIIEYYTRSDRYENLQM